MDTLRGVSRRPYGFSPPGSAAIVFSVVVATGAWLGAEWLRAQVLFLPAGLWIVFAAASVAWWRSGDANAEQAHSPLARTLHRPILRLADRTDEPASALEGAEPTSAWARGLQLKVLGPVLAELTRALTALAKKTRINAAETWERRLCVWHDSIRWADRPLRIGLDMPSDRRVALTGQEWPAEVEWVHVPAGTGDALAGARWNLDAIVREPTIGPVRVVTRQVADRETAWYDWSSPRPLTYASVFPGRVDPEQVSMDDADWSDPAQVAIVADLAHAAALLARLPHRLDLASRLNGRRPLSLFQDRLEQVFDRLSGRLTGAGASRVERAGARAIGAHYCSDFASADMHQRAHAVERAASCLPDEPEATLRLAAARFGTLDDDGAIDLILQADRALRRSKAGRDFDHLAFVQSEVEHGLPGPLTLGRVAAGICLVCASCPDERFDLIREDILDDLRFSGWLIGRDHDRAVLIEVFRRLRQARRDDLAAAA